MKDFKKIFLDTSPVIYFMDGDSPFREKTLKILAPFLSSDICLVTSVITEAEYLTYHYKRGNNDAVKNFWDFISSTPILLYPIRADISERAARIRADYPSFKLPDALQLATACISGCDLFLTNDKQLKQFKEIPCMTIEEWELI